MYGDDVFNLRILMVDCRGGSGQMEQTHADAMIANLLLPSHNILCKSKPPSLSIRVRHLPDFSIWGRILNSISNSAGMHRWFCFLVFAKKQL